MSYLELLKLASPEAVVVISALVVLDDWANEQASHGSGRRVA